MSFEVYLQCFGETEQTGIPRSVVQSYFPIVEVESEINRWMVRYDDLNYCEIFVSAIPSDQRFLGFISVWKPCADIWLWKALVEILRTGSVFLYWSGSPPILASDGVSGAFPKEIVDALGPPKSVSSAHDLLRLLHET